MKKIVGLCIAGALVCVGIAFAEMSAKEQKEQKAPEAAPVAVHVSKACCNWEALSNACAKLGLEKAKADHVNSIIAKYSKMEYTPENYGKCMHDLGEVLTPEQMSHVKATCKME